MGDCCMALPATAKKQTKGLVCLRCGGTGKPVDRITVEALLKLEFRARADGAPYVFCETSDCPVVYFARDGVLFTKDQIRVRVGVKERENPILVCYCFGITKQMIREEVRQTGLSTASTRIRTEVKAGVCRCEVENPSGRCCLGEVAQAEKRAVLEEEGSR